MVRYKSLNKKTPHKITEMWKCERNLCGSLPWNVINQMKKRAGEKHVFLVLKLFRKLSVSVSFSPGGRKKGQRVSNENVFRFSVYLNREKWYVAKFAL